MTDSVFAFGKMPSVGDFFRLGAPHSFVARWDDWVQTVLVAGQQGLGAGWAECYLSAPIWRFTLAPGLAGPQGVLGVFMPSVDRVGRQFPLTLAVAGQGDPVALHFGNDRLFARMEDTALACLDDDMTRDQLQTRLSALAAPIPPAGSHGPGWAVAPDLEALHAGVLARALSQSLNGSAGAVSLWTASLATGARFIRFDGLPAPTQALGLFDLEHKVWQVGGQ